MIEVTGDIWNYLNFADAICITTNGYVTKSYPRRAVMGRGTASQAKDRFRGIDTWLGNQITNHGNIVQICGQSGKTQIVSFPVKPSCIEKFNPRKDKVVSHVKNVYREGEMVPGFHAVAELKIIEQSVAQLTQLANSFPFELVVLPRPGCGAGELSWEQVQPIMERLDDRFFVINLK